MDGTSRAGGTPVRSEALFALKRAQRVAIAGMVLDNGPNQPPEIIDFENIAALAPPGASPASATGPSAPGDTQVAPASGTAAARRPTALPQAPPSLQQPGFGAPGQVPPATATATGRLCSRRPPINWQHPRRYSLV